MTYCKMKIDTLYEEYRILRLLTIIRKIRTFLPEFHVYEINDCKGELFVAGLTDNITEENLEHIKHKIKRFWDDEKELNARVIINDMEEFPP